MLRLATTAALLLFAAPAAAQILSPGKLAASHAEWEGLGNCTRCHEIGKKIDGTACLSCHTPLRARVQAKQGFHGRGAAAGRGCLDCHKDHRGTDAPLTEWRGGRRAFDHRGTGFGLDGAHATADCGKCHTAANTRDADIAARLQRKPESTYLGLSGACVPCHRDVHQGQLGDACARCHDNRRFIPASGFDHGASFALLGAHAKAKCDRCHPSDAQAAGAPPRVRYRPVAKECGGCHRDVHAGKFGARCQSCHGNDSWTRTRLPSGDVAFHARTKYPLVGRHVAAPCARCHPSKPGGGLVTRGIAFARCVDCHLDAHFGQMPVTEDGSVPCQRCHDEHGFYPSRFPLAEHDKSAYPLAGAHRAVACNRCHVADPARFAARVPPNHQPADQPVPGNRLLNFTRIRLAQDKDLRRCDSCHADPHRGQFQRGGAAKPCERCHTVEGFTPAHLDHDTDTAYPLTGKHRPLRCAACHVATADGGVIAWRGAATACAGCHADPHRGQFAASGCDACHDPNAFKPSRFSHADAGRAVFRLAGKHESLPCQRCHPPLATGASGAELWYRGIPSRCDGCHVDVHAGAAEASR